MNNQMTRPSSAKRTLVLVILLAAAVAAVAAWAPFSGRDEAEKMPELDGTSWILQTINGESLVADSEATIEFADGQVGGLASINRYFASYQLDGDKLTLGPAGSTMMAGPEELMNQEMAFLSALQTAASVSMDGRMLQIHYEGGVLSFIPAQ